MSDGLYDLTIIASKVQSGGVDLDGDGDGAPGGDFRSRATDNFFRLFGDADGDGGIDADDIAAFSQTLYKTASDPAYNALFDWDGMETWMQLTSDPSRPDSEEDSVKKLVSA